MPIVNTICGAKLTNSTSVIELFVLQFPCSKHQFLGQSIQVAGFLLKLPGHKNNAPVLFTLAPKMVLLKRKPASARQNLTVF